MADWDKSKFRYNQDFVFEPSEKDKKEGVLAKIPALARCPICGGMTDRRDYTMYAVCSKDPKHIFKWLPWGG